MIMEMLKSHEYQIREIIARKMGMPHGTIVAKVEKPKRSKVNCRTCKIHEGDYRLVIKTKLGKLYSHYLCRRCYMWLRDNSKDELRRKVNDILPVLYVEDSAGQTKFDEGKHRKKGIELLDEIDHDKG